MKTTKVVGFSTLIVLLVVGVVFGTMFWMGNANTVQVIEKTTTASGDAEFCANNPDLDMEIRIKDSLASTNTYINGTVLVKNLDTGKIVSYSINQVLGASAYDDSQNALSCTSKKGYDVWIQTDADDYNAAVKQTISPSMLKQDPVQLDFSASNHALISVKAYDNDAKASLYTGNASTVIDNVTTTQTMAATGAVYLTSAVGAIGKTVGTNGFFDYEMTLTPATANQANGQESFIAFKYSDESNTSDWDGDTLEITQDGTPLVAYTPSGNDVLALSGYNKFYKMNYPVGTNAAGGVKTQTKVSVRLNAASGVNPDYSPRMRVVELGTYQSNKDDTLVQETIGFQDDTSRTALGSATTQVVYFQIV